VRPVADKKDDKLTLKDYGAAVLATAPVAVGATLAGIPVKTTEGVLQSRLETAIAGTPKVPVKKMYARGLKRAGATAGGALLAGVLSTPLYARAIKKMSSDSSSERSDGVKLLVGQGIAYQAAKRFAESVGEARGGTPRAEIAKKFGRKMAGTALIGIPASIIMGKAQADARRKYGDAKTDKKDKSYVKSYLTPALVSGALAGTIGAVEGALEGRKKLTPFGRRDLERRVSVALNKAGNTETKEQLIKRITKQVKPRDIFRSAAPRAIAYGTAGVIGGAISKVIVDAAISRMSKKTEPPTIKSMEKLRAKSNDPTKVPKDVI